MFYGRSESCSANMWVPIVVRRLRWPVPGGRGARLEMDPKPSFTPQLSTAITRVPAELNSTPRAACRIAGSRGLIDRGISHSADPAGVWIVWLELLLGPVAITTRPKNAGSSERRSLTYADGTSPASLIHSCTSTCSVGLSIRGGKISRISAAVFDMSNPLRRPCAYSTFTNTLGVMRFAEVHGELFIHGPHTTTNSRWASAGCATE